MQDPTEHGKLVSVPPMTLALQRSQGTYYNAGSVTEITTSSMVAMFNNLEITDFVAWTNYGSQVQCFYQSTYPSGNTENKQCMLVINSITAAAITLNSNYRVEIDTATSFKWSKNGGALSASTPITTTGVSIDTGAATVYFVIATGFTVANAWVWTRTDCVHQQGLKTTALPLNFVTWRTLVYFINANGRVMKAAVAVTDSVPYIISAGYNPIYGKAIDVFYDHLMVVGYTQSSSWSTRYASLVTATSDVNDLDNFCSTDVNEADSYTAPSSKTNQNITPSLLGCFTYLDRFFIITNTDVYVTQYLGLPNVYSFSKFVDLDMSGWTLTDVSLYNGLSLVATGSTNNMYVISPTRLYLFNGTAFQDITGPILVTNGNHVSAHYLPGRKELWLRQGNNTCFVYNEITGSWHERYTMFGSTNVSCISTCTGFLFLGTTSRRWLNEDTIFLHTPVYNWNSGTTFGVPTIITQIISGGDFSYIKELDEVYGCIVTNEGTSTYFSNNSNAPIQLSWYFSIAGELDTSEFIVNPESTWDDNSPNGMFALPRPLSFRGAALQFTHESLDATKPPCKAEIYGFYLKIHNWPQTKVDQ